MSIGSTSPRLSLGRQETTKETIEFRLCVNAGLSLELADERHESVAGSTGEEEAVAGTTGKRRRCCRWDRHDNKQKKTVDWIDEDGLSLEARREEATEEDGDTVGKEVC